jgi:hypothetical protein
MSNFFDVLLKDKVWSAPTGDWQYPLQPSKISPTNGFIYSFNVGNTIIQLPDTVNPYHVFQVGRLNPELLKLTIGNDTWLSLSTMVNQYNMYAMAYSEYGIVFPRCNVFYRFHKNKNMYFALKWDYNVNIDYITLNNMYIRFFMSTYLEDNPSIDVHNFQCMSNTLSTSSDVENLVNYYNQFPEENTSVWVNGYLSSISQATTGVTADVLYDPSFKSMTISRLSSLPTFLSELDSQRKYLFHIDPNNIEQLDFLNNIDFYLIGQSNNNNYGLYIHRNNISNIRNVTFHDYAIKAINVQNSITNISQLPSSFDFYIMAIVRNSGFNLNMIDTKNRLLSLYNIDSTYIESLLAGLNSNSLWNAATLEKSSTNLYIQSYFNELNNYSPLDVGGYFSTTNELCNPIVLRPNNTNVITVPPCYTDGFTALEFSNGLLISINYNQNNGQYQIVNSNTDTIYFINGIFSHTYESIYNQWTSGQYTVPLNFEYRVYGSNGTYEDITAIVQSNSTENGIVLEYPSGYSNILVKTNQYILMQTFNFAANIETFNCVINDEYFTQIPYGAIDVFLNGYYLNDLVDYYVVGNNIYITNFEYIKLQEYNNVVVLLRGFCNSSMVMEDINEFSIMENTSGFVESFNDTIEKKYRPLVPTINNLLYNGITIIPNSTILNNMFYISLKTPFINSYKYLGSDSQTLLSESLVVNNTIHNLENVFNDNNNQLYPVNHKLTLVSAFLSTILSNLLNGEYDNIVYSDYVEADVGNYFLSLSQHYSNDPLWNSRVNHYYFKVIGFNINYPVTLNKQYFDFYTRVLNYYTNERLDYLDTVTNLSILV